MAVLVNL